MPRFLLKMDISQTAKLLYALLLDRTTLIQHFGNLRYGIDNECPALIVLPAVPLVGLEVVRLRGFGLYFHAPVILLFSAVLSAQPAPCLASGEDRSCPFSGPA